MKRNDRIRLYGARVNRFGVRLFIFIGMLAFYSLVLGGAVDSIGNYIYGILILIGLSVGLVILWFRSRKQQNIDRSHQLASETTVLYPSASEEEKQKKYTIRRRREIRVDAFFYMFLAALGALWFWGLHAVNAAPLSWQMGFWVIIPGLLLIAITLIIISVIPHWEIEQMPQVSSEELKSVESALGQQFIKPEISECTVLSLHTEKEILTAEEFLRRKQKEARSNMLFLFAASFLFCALPLILLGLDIYVVVVKGAPQWSLLFFSILALACIFLWLFMTRAMKSTDPLKSTIEKYSHLKNKNCHAFCDTIQSYMRNGDTVQIIFSQAGAVRCPLSPEIFKRYFCVPRKKAIIVKFIDRIESITLLPCQDEIIVDENLTSSIGTENDFILTDETLRSAALQKIERMPLSQRTEIEAEINQMLDQADRLKQKDYFEMTSEERSKLMATSTLSLHRSHADFDLTVIESTVMDALKVTRADIIHMKKNPFAPSLRYKLLKAAAVGIIGIVGTAAIEKITGTNLSFVYVVVSCITGVLALNCGETVINMFRFRKLQKAYKNPEYRQKALDAAVFREIKAQVEQNRQNNQK